MAGRSEDDPSHDEAAKWPDVSVAVQQLRQCRRSTRPPIRQHEILHAARLRLGV